MLFTTSIQAELLVLESSEKQKTVIELYTSEGCSSCPPAEEYLNTFVKKPGLWKQWIPVAFHVNYWDYIGWPDRFADENFGRRQSIYARLKRASTVYTPAFMVNGHAWRPGFFGRKLQPSSQIPGNLKVEINAKAGEVKATFNPAVKASAPLLLNVAVLGMDLTTHILRGENEGRQAKHEFVVVGYDASTSRNHKWKMKLPALHYKGATRYAIAAWISRLDNPSPIQAVGSYLNYQNK